MWPLLRKFFTDETAFTGYIRALLLGLGGLVVAYPDALPMLPKWAGIVALMGGGMIRAGDKNPKE